MKSPPFALEDPSCYSMIMAPVKIRNFKHLIYRSVQYETAC